MLVLEILQILFQTIWSFVLGILSALIEVVPTFLELKNMFGAFTITPADIISYCLGIPVALVSAIIIIVKLINYVRSKIVVDSYEEI